MERFSVARANVDVPPVIVIAGVYAPDELPSMEHLRDRLPGMLSSYPLLKCRILDGRTRSPRFVTCDLSADQVLFSDDSPQDSVDAIILAELEAGAALDLATGPLWRLTRHAASGTITLTMSHANTDGRGSLNALVRFLDKSVLPSPPDRLTPSLEQSLDVTPSWSQLLIMFYQEKIAKQLPGWLGLAPRPCWPHAVLRRPKDCAQGLRTFAWSATIVSRLKAVARLHGVATLQPVLMTAIMAALVIAVSDEEVLVSLSTPVSLRDARIHTDATGNFPTLIVTRYALRQEQDFWQRAREYAVTLNSPAERSWAQGMIGMIAYGPDSPHHKPTPEEPTEKEAILRRAYSTHPYFRGSVELSNLGAIRVPDNMHRIIFAQAASPMGYPLCFNAVGGVNRDLIITLTYFQDALGPDLIERLGSAFELAISRLISGEQAATFSELCS
ncbi:uncharacterized protein L969DRAFT_95281 [Mixia osmundae IAM 14324]|uniref:Condensation domain-containing protein n=1 Tax=Mixia osmundae (strain CBS 9802 / IAM 14324 / JCM 22182 / KY 12970) TaxID=764103 RepID=G7E6M1_MIXOS|nr:uncharacterized protein L969DRAFT_95281 [Mixia osmundae IAM 14324]KEI39141.1 hypothetical protein L969DRAFT_95281 [Mixia osmundae IAM 14324]GAA98481.1 hypothetical protein E5Q_05167 [Mixia osmundae IAM 14324]